MAAEGGTYVQFGAGYTAPPGWRSFDASPTLRIQQLPVVGKALAKLSGNADPFPEELLFGDIIRGLPVAENSVQGLYASHVLEHLSLDDMRRALRNSFRMLASDGVFRLIVPDLHARASQYVARAEAGDPVAAHDFMRQSYLGAETRPAGVAGKVRAQLGNSSHLWMWDFASMEQELKTAGFVDIRRAVIGDSGDLMFDRVEVADRFIDGDFTEVAIQARKP